MRAFAYIIACLIALVAAGTAGAARTDYLNAKKKFQSIEKQTVKAGAKVAITAPELNSYVQAELPAVAPAGVRNPKVELQGNNTATGRALIDFVKLRSAQGKPMNWMMRRLFEGEKEVAITTRIQSGGGQATVDLQRVEVAGVPIQGAALDFLLQNYLLPNYPDVKIGQPFKLHERVERIEVSPGVAYVTTK